MEQIQSIDLIAINPKVRNGRPVVAGTTICVSDLVMAMRFQHHTPDDLSALFALDLAQVYAALAYYYQHKPELDDEILARINLARELEEKQVGARKDSLLPR